MKLNLDLKTLILIISTSCVLAGFYYTTESRIQAVEREIMDVQQQTGHLKNDVKRLNKVIRVLKKERNR